MIKNIKKSFSEKLFFINNVCESKICRVQQSYTLK